MATRTGFRTEMNFEYGVPRELAPGVTRLVARNPGPFTFKGTNTYIVGSRALAIIDPGPDDEAHVDAIAAAVRRRRVTHVIITHRHRDHTGATQRLRTRFDAPVYAFGPVSFATPSDPVTEGGNVDRDFPADILLQDGERLAGEDWTLDVVHTPGHLSDHICLWLQEQSILFTGDHVMTWNTSVIAPPDGSMAAYLASLERLRRIEAAIYCPGHGGRVMEPQRTVRALQLHRQWREEAIMSSLRTGRRTITEIVADIYQGLDDRLVRAASLSVQAHIEHLDEQGRLTFSRPLTFSREIAVSSP